MAPKSVTFRQHDHLVSVLFGDLLNHSYNITFSIFLPRARMRNRGRVFGLSVSQFVCLSVCPPLFGQFAHSRHSQGLFIHSTGRSGGKSSL